MLAWHGSGCGTKNRVDESNADKICFCATCHNAFTPPPAELAQKCDACGDLFPRFELKHSFDPKRKVTGYSSGMVSYGIFFPKRVRFYDTIRYKWVTEHIVKCKSCAQWELQKS